ncbi:MAG: extracellular solute-binding protein [Firmicutes bacterium]|nr:extracellular solute-binding protein [Bacillota bacterium]
MMKRFLAAIAAAALVAGCSSGQPKQAELAAPKKNEPVKLQMLAMKQAAYSDEHVNEMVKKFTEANPNISVEITFVPYESLHDKLVTDQASGSGQFDVALVDEIWPAEFAAANVIQDITPRLTPEMKSGINPAVLNILAVGDKYYGVPWILDTKFLFYNKKMLADAGFKEPPKTWDELIKMAKAMKEKKIVEYPIAWSWGQAEAVVCDYTQLVYSFGGDILGPDGAPKFQEGAALDTLKWMVGTLNDGISNPNSITYLEEDVRQVFQEGKAAFVLNWTYMYGLANDPKESKVAGQVGIAPTPSAKAAIGVSGSMGLAITRSTKHPEEAWKLISFLTSEQTQKPYASDSLPIWKAALDASDLKADKELVAVAKAQFAAVKGRPQFVPWYNHFSTKLQVAIQNALVKKASPEDATKALVKEIEPLRKK